MNKKAKHDQAIVAVSEVGVPGDIHDALSELVPLREKLDWAMATNAAFIARRIVQIFELYPELAAQFPPDELAAAVVDEAPFDAGGMLRLLAVRVAAILDPDGPFRLELLTDGWSLLGPEEYLGFLRTWLASEPDLVDLNRLMGALRASRDAPAMDEILGVLAIAISPASSYTMMMLGMLTDAPDEGDAVTLTQRGMSVARSRTALDRSASRMTAGVQDIDSAALMSRYGRLREIVRPLGEEKQTASAPGLHRPIFVSWVELCIRAGSVIRANHLATTYADYDHILGTLSSDEHDGHVFSYGPYVPLANGEYTATFFGSVKKPLAAEFAIEAFSGGKSHRLNSAFKTFKPMSEPSKLVTLDFKLALHEPRLEFKIRLPAQQGRFELNYVSIDLR